MELHIFPAGRSSVYLYLPPSPIGGRYIGEIAMIIHTTMVQVKLCIRNHTQMGQVITPWYANCLTHVLEVGAIEFAHMCSEC
jgi:hypothetical protein